jgi:plasmid stabilization system protein ParE
MRVEFHPEAELELIEAASHYELQVPGLGEDFELEIRRATNLLQQHPEIGPHLDDELHQLVLNRFPYTLIYSVSSEVLHILVVAHQRRRPGYWRLRVNK